MAEKLTCTQFVFYYIYFLANKVYKYLRSVVFFIKL